ncbi:hypothetical protein [Actinomadura violacea]|uniref:Uncharacterized protein n=1 Tax=Actinomadura violacea TaxID=2819934 RepID=A0ABS3RY77_9ACTN|nr:hypothetical protein [Actinomadura violacea]MBO2461713.1 hypothetical protein [Actinomadura violacea]
MKVTFYGSSDDLVEVDGCPGVDEFGSYGEVWHGDLIAPGGPLAPGGAMRVHVFFDGCWHVSVGQVDETIPLPDWPIRFEQQKGYDGTPSPSVLLTVDAPDGVRLDNVHPDNKPKED